MDGADCAGLDFCDTGCLANMVGDGICQDACRTSANCQNDAEDCTGYCAQDCRTEDIGNAYCDVACFREECSWDNGDCANHCVPDCFPEEVGDGTCNMPCNVAECMFDAGDCEECSPGCYLTQVGSPFHVLALVLQSSPLPVC